MFNILEYNEIANDNNVIYIDVRSPKEFREDTIPGAINIPVLLDDEREIVGTTYVQKSVEEAKSKGIDFISKRLPEIFNLIQDLYINNKEKKLVLFCSRGGMRSGSIHSLLQSLGVKVYKLKHGYKGYRKYINDNLSHILNDIEFIVLHGKTGVGKTKILEGLAHEGYDILNLEEAANHRGSLLGSVALGEQSTQKRFETYVFNSLKVRKNNLVFIEGESKRIGNIIIPECLWTKMEIGYQVLIEADLELRTEILLDEYTKNQDEVNELVMAIDSLKRYMNEERVEKYKCNLVKGEFIEVAQELMEKYYDPLYNNSLKKKNYCEIVNLKSVPNGMEQLKKIFEIQINNRD